jgi:large subunit ribosomal protein L3
MRGATPEGDPAQASGLERAVERQTMTVQGIIGRKLGMTQLYADDGTVLPVTVIQAGPCVVVQCKTSEKDGYTAVQLGLVESRKVKSVAKPLAGHFAKTGKGLPPCRVLRELRVPAGSDLKVGDKVGVDIFAAGDVVHVTGLSKGKGFQGVIKRWGFHGGKITHGSKFHRELGSTGNAGLSGLWKGRKMPGRMGGEHRTVQNLALLRIDAEKRFILVKGAVPGRRRSLVVVTRAKKGQP